MQTIYLKKNFLIRILGDSSEDLSVRGTGLSDNGVPMVSLSNGKSYAFSSSMSSW